ncbi:hypothetical protein A4X13_0g870 [Tilletia indica]|uniref:Major facilitator superfamily (MFS) profile domain-containing protein n=1 Tax=Tilletia indica TaxID=43049 RepID=A0A177TFC5_9BASI|nr:hypothetical protein A4X13_0g870 [Tilletia indica]
MAGSSSRDRDGQLAPPSSRTQMRGQDSPIPHNTSSQSISSAPAAAADLEVEHGFGNGYGESSDSVPASSLVQRKNRSRNKYRYAVLYSAIFCIAFAISLDANTGYLYLNWACSEYGALSAFSTVSIVQQLTMAIAKPPLAKISDVFGRAQAYTFSLMLYVCGYLIVTFSSSLRSLLCGLMLVSAGITGLQTLQSIIVADTTAPRYRGLVIGLCNIPFLINFLIAGPLVDLVLRNGTWRLGYGMWIIAMPIAAAPLLVTLTIGQRHARRAGLRHRVLDESQNFAQTMRILATELDVFGIVLFSLSFALMLLPITLRGHGSSVDTGVAKLLFILGLILVGAFVRWEAFARQPLLPLRFFTNKTVVLVCLIGIADFGSFFLSWSFLSSFVQIVKGWDQTQTGWFASTQNVTSTAQGILVGLIMARNRRFKHILVWGVVIRLVGVSLMIKYRNADDPTIVLVLCQLLQGIGGGSIAIVMQVAVQIAVQRKDVASVTALELLTAEIGAAIGSALAGMLFAMDLPKQLATTLPQLSAEERNSIYSSLQVALSYPMGSPIRNGISEAWVHTMRLLCIAATLFLLPALFLAMALPDLKLPERHIHRHLSSTSRHKRRSSSMSRRRRVASAPSGLHPSVHRANDGRLTSFPAGGTAKVLFSDPPSLEGPGSSGGRYQGTGTVRSYHAGTNGWDDRSATGGQQNRQRSSVAGLPRYSLSSDTGYSSHDSESHDELTDAEEQTDTESANGREGESLLRTPRRD